MQIRQFQLANDSLQDRLLLRISLLNKDEIRIWLTRRFVRTIWPYLAEQLRKHPAPPQVAPAETAAPVEPALDKPFDEEANSYPLGLNPILASQLTLDTLTDGNFRLTFREGKERNFQLTLDLNLLRIFCSMLRARNDAADWGLTLDYAATVAAPACAPAAQATSGGTLH